MHFRDIAFYSKLNPLVNREVDLKQSSTTVVLALACASFFGLGVITAAIGPALPELAGNTSTTLAAVGSLFTGLYFGSLAAQLLSGPLLDRLGPRWLTLVGLPLIAAGILGVTTASTLSIAVISAVLTGIGYGAIALIMNVAIANLFSHRRASALNLINMFYGIGAFLAPAVAGLSLSLSGSSLSALWLGGGLELLLLPLFFRFFQSPQATPAPSQTSQAQSSKLQIFRSPVLWVLSLMLLIYVGTENGAGGWVSTYIQQTTPLAAATAALAASVFWLAFTTGRMLGTILGARWSARALLTTCLTAALIGGLLIVASTGNVPLSFIGFMLLGLGLGPTFPTALAVITASYPRSAGTATSLAMAMGFIGGMFIPWLLGIILDARGPRAGAALLPLGALIMLGCLAVVRYLKQRETDRGNVVSGIHAENER